MKFMKTEFFDTFECIGGDCPDTCCAGWNITILREIWKFCIRNVKRST